MPESEFHIEVPNEEFNRLLSGYKRYTTGVKDLGIKEGDALWIHERDGVRKALYRVTYLESFTFSMAVSGAIPRAPEHLMTLASLNLEFFEGIDAD